MSLILTTGVHITQRRNSTGDISFLKSLRLSEVERVETGRVQTTRNQLERTSVKDRRDLTSHTSVLHYKGNFLPRERGRCEVKET